EVSLTEGRPRGEEAEAHHRSAARLALDRELAAVGEDEVLHDRQPEAGPAELTGAGAVDPVEALGDAGQVGGRDADPGIRDPDLDQRGPDAARTHRDAAAGRRSRGTCARARAPRGRRRAASRGSRGSRSAAFGARARRWPRTPSGLARAGGAR